MTPKIGISESNLKKSASLLTTVLSDEMTLYIKTRKFHWNITGNSFMELHKLFEAQYAELEEAIDEIAERINKLGSKTIGTMKEFSNLSRLEEKENNYPEQNEMISDLLKDHQILITEIRKDIDACSNENHDAGTADLLTKILQQHETMAWILRRYLN
ncbi:DNA starvation/stationary phase protection protein [Flavobacterium sp. AS60]|uniref:Dps family protein n=1 Tax=Flavobacterium anseongense TaxID=2910677 RepID=UPI001F2C7F88|nr:DNA starvation/stationary phase protection protein [Flavobacterium sp. AS60]MCF6129615.1 DNA starvation/stationary phase protection protein [Flavobacterium sp. AS60]